MKAVHRIERDEDMLHPSTEMQGLARVEGEAGFYTEDEIETLLEDDEISVEEEGFMRGYIDS